MSIENNETPKLSLGQATSEIEGIRGEIAMMGANDSEFESLSAIIATLNDRECTPEEAVVQARRVRDTKQAYH